MRKVTAFIVLVMACLSSVSQIYQPVEEKSSVKFRIKNFGFNNVTGSFKGLQGTVQFDPENLAATRMDVTVDAKSVSTGINLRDNHLRKEEYFDVKKYPVIRFVSSKITPSSKAGTLFMFGKLTIKNVTREISFPFTAIPQEGGYLFNGEFKINRINFGIGESSSVSDNLMVTLNVFAGKG
jgi:polyisoprenoid-binding protein YceI